MRNLREVGLRVRHAKVLGLRAVDCVAKAPTADCFVTFAVATLGELARQTCATLAAGRDRPDQNAFANFVAGYTRAQLFNNTDRFMADDQAGVDAVFTA